MVPLFYICMIINDRCFAIVLSLRDVTNCDSLLFQRYMIIFIAIKIIFSSNTICFRSLFVSNCRCREISIVDSLFPGTSFSTNLNHSSQFDKKFNFYRKCNIASYKIRAAEMLVIFTIRFNYSV